MVLCSLNHLIISHFWNSPAAGLSSLVVFYSTHTFTNLKYVFQSRRKTNNNEDEPEQQRCCRHLTAEQIGANAQLNSLQALTK